MRVLIDRNASDNGELSGAAVEIRISVCACAKGKAISVAVKTAVAMNDRLMVRS
jgi:DNA-binding protein